MKVMTCINFLLHVVYASYPFHLGSINREMTADPSAVLCKMVPDSLKRHVNVASTIDSLRD